MTILRRAGRTAGSRWGRCAALVLLAATPLLATPVDDLCAKLPATSVADGQQLIAALVKLGPDAVKELVERLPKGGPTTVQAKFALNGLAQWVTRPGAEAERAMLTKALLANLGAVTDPANQVLVLSLVQQVGKADAVAALSKLLSDASLAEPATQALQAIGGPEAIQALLAAVAAGGPTRASVVRALGVLRAPAAIAPLLKLAEDADPALRQAVLAALANLGAPAAGPLLKQAAAVTATRERTQGTANLLLWARRQLESGRAGDAVAVARDLLRDRTKPGDAHAAAAALDLLVAAGDQGVAADLLKALDSPARALRGAALRLLAGLPLPASLPAVLEHLPKASPARRAELIAWLADRTHPKAQQAVLAALTDAEAVVRLAAVEVAPRLQAAAVPALVARLAATDAAELKAVRAALGRIRPELVVPALGALLQAARQPAQQALALQAVAAVRTPAALALVLPLLKAEASREAAAAAAVALVMGPSASARPLRGKAAEAAMQEVAKVAKDEGLRERAQEYLDRFVAPANDPNLALNKPVETNVAPEGDRVAERAVDGNSGDASGSAWFGSRWPCWLKVDLGEAKTIDTVRVWFYWLDGRYYQYTIEVSTDGKEWKQVADRSKTTEPGTAKGDNLTFAPVSARYVRISILKNSANQAIHLVELKVYAPGTAPAAPAAPKPPERPKPEADGWITLFNGRDLSNWMGNTGGYLAEGGVIHCTTKGGVLFTPHDYANFHLKFEFKLTPAANNGVGIRFPLGSSPSSDGMEIQILDDTAPVYAKLKAYQYHGSVYFLVPAKRGHQKPVGEWNSEEIIANGRHITVILNGVTIVDCDLDEALKNLPKDWHATPGAKSKTGRLGFLGHGAELWFRNIRLKELPD